MSQSTHRVKEDLKAVVHDVGEAARAAADGGRRKVERLRERTDAQLDAVSQKIAKAEHRAADSLRRSSDRAIELMRANPWWAITGAAVAVLLLSRALRRF